MCLALALAQTGWGHTGQGEFPEKKQKKNKIMFLKIGHLVLSDSLMLTGADSYSNEKHIITTARACSTAYAIIGGLEKKHPITSRQC